MRVFLTTLGCRLNEAELSSWARDFNERGAQVVHSGESADVVVLNTCAVTSEAARKSRKLASKLHRDNPNARLILTGCFAQLEPEHAQELAGVDAVVGNREKKTLVDVAFGLSHQVTTPARQPLPMAASRRTRAFIKVQDGCRNKCSFCIVTVARGEEVSRKVGDVISEINDLHSQGVQEAVLTGVHLGGYGSDIGSSLKELVTAVLEHTDVPRVRLSSLEPWDLPEGFWSLWDNPKLQPHLHLPLQSGSDSVLRRMSRRCFTQDFKLLVESARACIPHLNVTTDLIVGFPGESEEEWRQSVEYVRDIGFGHIHVFPYSAREGTRAASLPGQLSGKIRKQRSVDMRALAAEFRLQALQEQVEREADVLWESSRAGKMRGYTDNYFRVVAKSGTSLVNTIERVRIKGVSGDSLVASLV